MGITAVIVDLYVLYLHTVAFRQGPYCWRQSHPTRDDSIDNDYYGSAAVLHFKFLTCHLFHALGRCFSLSL